MGIPSPFDGLHLDREVVCDFFAVFSRFEFALKESGFVRSHRGLIEPAWKRYGSVIATLLTIEPGSPLDEAIDYLCNEPPLFQVGATQWEQCPLQNSNKLEQAIDAIKQVQNNLFHSAKHTPHSLHGRDNKLVKSSLFVLMPVLWPTMKSGMCIYKPVLKLNNFSPQTCFITSSHFLSLQPSFQALIIHDGDLCDLSLFT